MNTSIMAASNCGSARKTRPSWHAPPALEQQDLASFILHAAMPRAQKVIMESEKLKLSERDSLLVLDLLEHPLEPSARLIAAAKAGFSLE